MRDDYAGDELARYDARRREIYHMLKHRDGKYMAQFAAYMRDGCETAMRAYHKMRASKPNTRRPRCTNPVLRQGAGACTIFGRDFKCRLADAPRRPLLASPYVVLRFPVTPHGHAAEFRLTPYVVEKLAGAVSVGAVTVTATTLSVAFEPRRVEPVMPRGITGMDVNKAEHTTADTDGNMQRIPNDALEYARERRAKHAGLGVTGGKPNKHGRRKGANSVKRPGRKPKNKGKVKKRRDGRVNRRERARINTRFRDRKTDWLHKLMHRLACTGMALALEDPTIDRLLVRSNRRMSREQRDLLKMGLSQGAVWEVATGVFAKHGLPVLGIRPAGTSSACPACGDKLWSPKYGTKIWNAWRRAKACVPCLYYADRDDVAAMNITCRGVSAYEPAAVPGQPGRRVAGDWGQRAPQLVQVLLGAAAVRFPYVGEGRRPKGGAKNPPHMAGDARLPDDRPDASNGWAGVGPPDMRPGALC